VIAWEQNCDEKISDLEKLMNLMNREKQRITNQKSELALQLKTFDM
jgi:hypothetical protein